MIPFFSTTFYAGPAAKELGGADISFVFGLVFGLGFAGGPYYLLARNLDRSVEAEAIRVSDLEIEGTASRL